MGLKKRYPDSRERLIMAGIADIEQHGVANLSLRRVAKACDVSCAAPYRHFIDKSDFLVAIMDYISSKWYATQSKIMMDNADDPFHTLYELAIAYTEFLVENPHFRSVIMMKTTGLDAKYRNARANLSADTKRLIGECCQSLGIAPEIAARKTFVIRSIIYGASLMLDNGQSAADTKAYGMVRDAIAAELRS